MNSSHDYDYHNRLEELSQLMLAHPHSKMKSLQKSALRMFPVGSKEVYRHCMSSRFAFRAADLANKELLQGDNKWR